MKEKKKKGTTMNKLDRFDMKDPSGIDKDVPFWATLFALFFFIDSVLSMFIDEY